MQKLLLSALLFVCFGTTAFSQIRYTISPNPAEGTGLVTSPDTTVDSEIHNLTSQTLSLHWVRNIISLTPGCETAICDAQVCYGRGTGEHNFSLLPEVTKPFLVHFYNNNAPCSAIIHVKVTNNNDAADSVNVVFLFNQSVDTKELPLANVKLYPNPVTQFFSLENADNVSAIRVFNLDGQVVTRFDAVSNKIYSLIGQPAGQYIIALEDKNGQTFQALLVMLI